MANTPHRHLPPDSSSEASTSSSTTDSSRVQEIADLTIYFTNKLTQILADTVNGRHDEALESIKELFEFDNNSSVNYKYLASLSFECASVAKNSLRSEKYLQIAFDCVRKALRIKPRSLELIHYSASSLYKYSDDCNGFKKAIQECEKGLKIVNRRSKRKNNWKNKFCELSKSCNLKLIEVEQKSQETEVSQSDSIQKMTNPKKEQVKVDDNGAKEKLEAEKNRATLCSNTSESKLREIEQRSASDSIPETENLKEEKIQIDDKCAKEKPKIKQNRANLDPNSSESCLLQEHLKRVVDNGAKDFCPESKTTTKKNMKQIAAPRISFEEKAPVPKTCKENEPNKRDMTNEEKKTIAQNLQSLPSEDLEKVVQILQSMPSEKPQIPKQRNHFKDGNVQVCSTMKKKKTIQAKKKINCRNSLTMKKNTAQAKKEMKIAPAAPKEAKQGKHPQAVVEKEDELKVASEEKKSEEFPEFRELRDAMQKMEKLMVSVQKLMVSAQTSGEVSKLVDLGCVKELLSVNAQLAKFVQTTSTFLSETNSKETNMSPESSQED